MPSKCDSICDYIKGKLHVLDQLKMILAFITLVLTAVYYARPFLDRDYLDVDHSSDVGHERKPGGAPRRNPLMDTPGCKTQQAYLSKEYKRILNLIKQFEDIRDDGNRRVGRSTGTSSDTAGFHSACYPARHVVEEEIVLGILASIILITLILQLFKTRFASTASHEKKRIYTLVGGVFHVLQGLILLIASILWFTSINGRSLKLENHEHSLTETSSREEHDEERKNFLQILEKYGNENVILFGERREVYDWTKQKDRDEVFVACLMNGILIMLNSILYSLIGVIVIKTTKGNRVGHGIGNPNLVSNNNQDAEVGTLEDDTGGENTSEPSITGIHVTSSASIGKDELSPFGKRGRR